MLSRVQAFLPELAASNADLLRQAKEDPNSVDIENVDDDQAQYIEMVSLPTFFLPFISKYPQRLLASRDDCEHREKNSLAAMPWQKLSFCVRATHHLTCLRPNTLSAGHLV